MRHQSIHQDRHTARLAPDSIRLSGLGDFSTTMKHSHNFEDKTGKRFGRLLVIEIAGRNKHSQILWRVRCDCGNEKVVLGCGMQCGHTKSCGCLNLELVRRARSHGFCSGGKTDEYKVWLGMWKRCTNKKTKCYKHYGARGIKVCEKWGKFVNFIEDMGERPSKKHSLERIDNDKGYSPSNCRWATQKEQMSNTRVSVRITHNGETLSAAQWADRLGMKRYTFYSRINQYGWSVEKAITTPVLCRT